MGFDRNIIKAFKDSIEEKCITLLVSAYQSSITNSDYRIDWMENDFTSMIDKYIDQNPNRKEWEIHCNVEQHLHNNTIRNDRGYANHENRIDMRLSKIKCKQEFTYFIEAKRLKEHDASLHKRYIETGIDNFVSGKYPNGILLAYLVEGNVNKTIAGICSLLCKNNRNSEVLSAKHFELYNHYYESVHSGFGIIKHLIFDYTV